MNSPLNWLFRICMKPFSYQRKNSVLIFSIASPYLLLVSFASGTINDFGASKISAINNSPYDGVTVSLALDGDVKQYKEADFEQAVATIKRDSRKHVWPWIYLNRMIGIDMSAQKPGRPEPAKTFKDIRGMDLSDKAGALSAFYDHVRLAARMAKELGSPGIMVDLEAYNDYQNYDLGYLSTKLGQSKAETVHQLLMTGEKFADIVDQEYPTATIWFTFTGLASPVSQPQLMRGEEYRSVTYIVQGLLQQAKDRNYPLTVVSGGMLSMGYCYDSLEDLQNTIRQRQNMFQHVLKEYPALRLGGTIAPWKDAGERREGYFRGRPNKCGKSPVQNLQQFKPYIDQLLRSYKYVWIYAASDVKYNPYDPSLAPEYNRVIEESLRTVR